MRKNPAKALATVLAIIIVLTSAAGAIAAGDSFDAYKAKTLGDMRFFFGNLHSHTGYSDGEGTPENAYQWARDTAKFDFYAVTDHAEEMVPAGWQDTMGRANQFNRNGSFTALAGFEWSSGSGHVCVLNTTNYTNAYATRGLESLYGWMASNGGYGEFNHPAKSAGTFYEFAPTANPNAKRMRLIETANSGAGNNTGFFYDYFIKALDSGWAVAPVSNQDNHSLSTNSHRTGVIARALTRGDILDAIAKRRVYSTDDSNLQVALKCGATWMGSGITRSSGKCAFDVMVEDDEDLARVDLITNGGKVVASRSFEAKEHIKRFGWKPEVEFQGPRAYYFV
ncbi:MAG: CehA/McbA family metallohydrolase, partial [Candidatus Geothermincolia bacterium]